MTTDNLNSTQPIHEMLEVKKLLVPSDVNSHIKLGWKLIGTFNSSSEHEKRMINYCIGWPKTAGNVKKPEEAPAHKTISNKHTFIYSL